jgi:histidyl-tRNA synthetase
VSIEAPILERQEVLFGKQNEQGGKLIDNLEDERGELLSLRHNLSVPFATFRRTARAA